MLYMKTKPLTFAAALAAVLCVSSVYAADKSDNSSAMDKTFIMKAANGGMTEVELGKIAAQKGASQDIKDFGSRMVKDHSKANDQLKEVASKVNVTVPSKLDAKHQAMVDKMSGLSGAAFDQAYAKAMVKDHEEDISEFKMADKQVKNADLKKFIEKTVPVMQEHLEMIKKFDQVKKS